MRRLRRLPRSCDSGARPGSREESAFEGSVGLCVIVPIAAFDNPRGPVPRNNSGSMAGPGTCNAAPPTGCGCSRLAIRWAKLWRSARGRLPKAAAAPSGSQWRPPPRSRFDGGRHNAPDDKRREFGRPSRHRSPVRPSAPPGIPSPKRSPAGRGPASRIPQGTLPVRFEQPAAMSQRALLGSVERRVDFFLSLPAKPKACKAGRDRVAAVAESKTPPGIMLRFGNIAAIFRKSPF